MLPFIILYTIQEATDYLAFKLQMVKALEQKHWLQQLQ